MRRSLVCWLVAAALVAPAGRLGVVTAAAAPGFTVLANQSVVVTGLGPNGDQSCSVAYDLYLPSPPAAPHSAPAILTTNGFGGSKADQAALGALFAPMGYVVLSYSGLGFGGSGCNIELDQPQWDGRAASQLITLLGNRPEVKLDSPGDPAHGIPPDPRVGMIGGSYGGAVQFATASIDPRLDTIVPVITWNDLAYSLVPNNDRPSLAWDDSPAGVPKLDWTELFFGDGLTQPLTHVSSTPVPPSTCPGFDPQVCQDNLSTIASGYATPQTVQLLRHASMVGYGSSVRIPTMLIQGEADTLFNIDEAVANRALIQAKGAPVKLVLQSWGHSNSTPAPGEYSFDPSQPSYERDLVEAWFARYLGGQNVDTGPSVEYFRDWVSYTGSARPAYGHAHSWPVGGSATFDLSGASALVPKGAPVAAGSSAPFVNPAAPPSYSETSGVQTMQPFASIPPSDPPAGSAAYTSAPLPSDLDVVGVPTATLRIGSAVPPAVYQADPSLLPELFTKVYDVAPDGSIALVERLVSPVREADLSRPVTVTLPAIVHRYPAGHRLRLVVSTTDAAYAPSRLADSFTVTTDAQSPSTLTLPTDS